MLLLPTPETGKSTVQVLDFNVRRGRVVVDDDDNDDDDDRDADVDHDVERLASGRKTTRSGIVDYPTCIVMPSIFIDAVESGLPYREVLREVQGDYSGMMIDDERLVGLKVRSYGSKADSVLTQ